MIGALDLFLLAISLFFFFYGVIKRISLWRVGKDENRYDNLTDRVGGIFQIGFGHTRTLKEKLTGITHLLIFYAFIIPFVIVVFCQANFSFTPATAATLSIFLDILGFMGLVSTVVLFARRLIVKDKGFDTKTDDLIALILLFGIYLTGFLVEGSRIAISGGEITKFSPIGALVSSFTPATPKFLLIIWKIHFISVLGFIAYIPYSKLFHIISAPLNIFFRNLKHKGYILTDNLEDKEEFGVNNLEQFSWKTLLDFDACVRCGRCSDNCPANITGKPLNPKEVIQKLKVYMENYNQDTKNTIIREVLSEDEVWACTTCLACVENCPMMIEHTNKIIDLRQYLVLMESNISGELQLAFRNIENNGNPWGVGHATRADWTEGLNVPILGELEDAEKNQIEYLFWPGCAGAVDDRYKKVSKSMVNILKKAGIKFAILGTEEKCCGDPARKAGNEYLYQNVAKENIETMNNHGIKKIITACPHCFTTLAKDYKDLGGNYEVIHHTQLIQDLISSGKLIPNKTFSKRVIYHDSCYLGRWNEIYDEPREILNSIKGVELLEFDRNRTKGFCCGAGGGRMFMEETIGERINNARVKQGLDKNPECFATACPFCLTMLVDGIKEFGKIEEVEIKDIAEIVDENSN